MSRGRFLYIDAIGKVPGVRVDTWGKEWPGYKRDKSVSENIAERGVEYDVVYAYKPLEHIKFAEVDALRVIEYNEMYNVTATNKEIIESDAQLLLCHHRNEMDMYLNEHPTRCFVHIPHCSDPNIFHTYNDKKKQDVLLIGKLSWGHYPLRTRVATEVIPALVSLGYTATVWAHPGYDIENANNCQAARNYAKAVSRARIAVFCSGTHRTRYAKYNEAPFCGTAVAADVPDEDPDHYDGAIIKILNEMSSQDIVHRIVEHLENPELLKQVTDLGRERTKHFTTTWYAERAVEAMKSLLVK